MALYSKRLTTLALCTAIALGGCSENKTVEEYLAAAASFTESSDYRAAVIELKNAVRMAPKNAELRLALGKTYLLQGFYLGAEKELERAQSLGDESEQLLVDLAFIKHKLLKHDEVFNLVDSANLMGDENYLVMLTYAGISAINSNDLEKATDYFQQANDINELAIYSRIGNAYLEHSKENFNQSIDIIDTVIAEQPQLTEALLLKAHILFSLDKFQEAHDSYSKYREMHPLARHIRFFEINSLMQAEAYEAAEVKVDELIKLVPDSGLANQYKAQIEFQKENYEQAKNIADFALQKGNNFYVARMIAGISAYKMNEIEQAYGYLNTLEQYLPPSHPVNRVLTIVKIKLGYTEEASKSLDSLIDITEQDSGFLQATSAEMLKAGDLESAKKLIEQASSVSPNDANIAVQKGLILLSENDLSGIKSLEYALTLNPDQSDVEMALALQYIKNGNTPQAEIIANKWLKSEKNKRQGFLLTGIIFGSKNLTQQAVESFEQVLKLENNNIAALYFLAMIAEQENDFAKSIRLYKRIIDIQPSHVGAIERLSQLQFNQNNLDDNIAFMKKKYAAEPDNMSLLLGLAQNLRLAKKVEEAIKLLIDVNLSLELPAPYWVILGDSYIQLNKFTNAEESFSKALKLFPEHYLLLTRYIGVLERLRRFPQAYAVAQSALNTYPENDRIIVLNAYFAFRINNKTSLHKMLAVVEEKGIEHHLTHYVAGELALNERDYPKAIEYFTLAYNAKNTQINALQLARSLKFNGQHQEAEKLLERFMEENPKDTKMGVLLAELYTDESIEKKERLYQNITTQSPNNVTALNNYAWLKYQQKDLVPALTMIKKAYELAPESQSIKESFGVILVANNEYVSAEKILTEVLNAGSKEINVQLAYAKVLIESGQKNKALKLLNQIKTDDQVLQDQMKQLKAQSTVN